MRNLYKFAAVLVLLGTRAGLARAERTRDVIVYSYVTPAGKKMLQPTHDHPAIYLLIKGGYREEGEKVAGEKSPPPEKVESMVRNALAAANYQGVTADSRELDYIIAYHWGYMNPEKIDGVTFNQPMMLALVAGGSLDKMNPGFPPWEDITQAADNDRYFIVISAYSPGAYVNHHEKKLLWRAQMSLDSDGTTQDESMPALVSASVAYLGHETTLPQEINESLERPSQVIISAPVVKEYLPAIETGDLPDAIKKN
ncbi:MAG TPA: hypothetical protein VK717_03385 [Opitutaceae bacterium]|jgi:hypothetical protein|nr:hypothetical protein [Opitutaceae bacterium]